MSTSTPGTIKNHAVFIWSAADLLRGDYKQSEYGKVILPLTVIRRLDCVLEPTKPKVLAVHRQYGDRDAILRAAFGEIMVNSMGAAVASNVSSSIHTVDGADVCRVHVHASGFPVDAKVTVDKDGQMIKKTAFFVRASNATRALDDTEKAKYILGRWPTRSTSPENNP